MRKVICASLLIAAAVTSSASADLSFHAELGRGQLAYISGGADLRRPTAQLAYISGGADLRRPTAQLAYISGGIDLRRPRASALA